MKPELFVPFFARKSASPTSTLVLSCREHHNHELAAHNKLARLVEMERTRPRSQRRRHSSPVVRPTTSPPEITHGHQSIDYQPHDAEGTRKKRVCSHRCGVPVGLAHLLEHRQIEDP